MKSLNRKNLINYGYELVEGNFYNYFLHKDKKNTEILDLNDKDITSIEAGTFRLVKNLKKVILPEKLIRIDPNAFFCCKNLEEVIFPDSLEIIKENAFMGCNLKKFMAPKNLKCINNYAFSSNSIVKAVLNEKLEIIGPCVFTSNKIENITLPKSLKHVDQSFIDRQKTDKEVKIYVPKLFKEQHFTGATTIYSLDDIITNAKSFKEINNIYKETER